MCGGFAQVFKFNVKAGDWVERTTLVLNLVPGLLNGSDSGGESAGQ